MTHQQKSQIADGISKIADGSRQVLKLSMEMKDEEPLLSLHISKTLEIIAGATNMLLDSVKDIKPE